MATLKANSDDTGMHQERLGDRAQHVFFEAEEEENFTYPDAYEVDYNKRTTLDIVDMDARAVNRRIRECMAAGYGTIVLQNPSAKHSLAVGILNRLHLYIEGSLGYFGCGLIDGPNIRVSGRVGWSCAENMMSGTVVIEKNAGSTFGAALRGGDLVCKGDVGSRTGIDMKGGTIIVGGRTGILSGFMMQRGRMIVCGNAGDNLGDSMYDGTIFVGGKIASLGVDATEGEMSELEEKFLQEKLKRYEMPIPKSWRKVVSGKQLWNYDNLEPAEKKLIL